MRKHYLIYQITNQINQKIYIGKHETYNVDDNYFGSGKLIQAAIRKYGIENFVKTILFELQNREEMNLLEKAVVTSEFCAREDVYNINVGGDGGWSYINLHSDVLGGYNFVDYEKYRKMGVYKQASKKWLASLSDIEKKCLKEKLQACGKRSRQKYNKTVWKGKHHTVKTKQKLSIIGKQRLYKHPEQNAMLNSVWIINEQCELSIPVKKDIAYQMINDNDNWKYGKCNNFEKYKQQINFSIMERINTETHLQRQKELYYVFYSFYYQEYLKLGYKQFQQKYQFDIERTALLHLFKRYAFGYQRYKRNRQKAIC